MLQIPALPLLGDFEIFLEVLNCSFRVTQFQLGITYTRVQAGHKLCLVGKISIVRSQHHLEGLLCLSKAALCIPTLQSWREGREAM